MSLSTPVTLESISLFLDEQSPLKGPSVASLLPNDLLPYKLLPLPKNVLSHAAHISFMPDVFQRRLSVHSKDEFIAVNQIYRVVEMIRYNFSDGWQVSAKEILRHPHHIFVPEEFLPQLKHSDVNFVHTQIEVWPLIQTDGGRQVKSVADIMQCLLGRIIVAHRQKKIELFLQTHAHSGKSLPLQSILISPSDELRWRIDFNDRKKFRSQFQLISDRRTPFYFFDSFALEPASGLIVVHPWKTEFSFLQEQLSHINDTLFLAVSNGMPAFEIEGENKTKNLIQYLRTRRLTIVISGSSQTVRANESATEIHFTDTGLFTLQHEARVSGQKNLTRQGWSERAVFYMMALSQGLPFAMQLQARDMASQDEFKRDWDLSLLRHLGILQYVFLETLSVYFDGVLTDGTPIDRSAIFSSIDHKIKALLLFNTDSSASETAQLEDLCSRSVLACFEKIIDQAITDISRTEHFYSEDGEVSMEGVLEREFRLIYEMLKRLAIVSKGETFKKVRAPFLNRVSQSTLDSESAVARALYHFPDSALHGALEIAQSLVPFGFKIFLKNESLHELGENDLKIQFRLQNRVDQAQINWFELSPKFFLMGQEVDADNIIRVGSGGVIEYENKYYLLPKMQMPTLRLLEEFWKHLQKGKTESARKKYQSNHYQLPRSQTLYLLALRNAGIPFQGDADWDKLCAFYDQLGKTTESFQLPPTIQATLKPYQETGVRWLLDLYYLRLGALLADDMGLGKTLQALAFLESLRTKNEMGSVLVVVPSSLVFNWQNEIDKFTPEIPHVVFSGERRESIANIAATKQSKLVIITYGLLLEHSEVLNRQPWNVVIFDEAQNIKNIHSKRTTAARSLKSRFKIALTGTPMENHYGEFYSIADMLVPGCLGPWENFQRAYVTSPVIDYELIQILKQTVRPLLLRRAKKEILDQLPPKQESVVKIAFEEQQKEIYRNVALSYNRRIHEALASQGVAEVQLEMFTALLRLRQVCSDPAALPNVSYDKTPPKLETLVDAVKEIVESGESALVFTQFLQTLERTTELLESAGVTVYVLHGGISSARRQKIISEFTNHQKGCVLLMTLRTGGVGLNLTKASYVFHIEPWWNPAVENQATDRAHRMGQTKSVQVFNYIIHESLEEKIEVLKDRKANRFQSLFTDQEAPTEKPTPPRSLTKEDFDHLIEL